jgi:hypothetical protein
MNKTVLNNIKLSLLSGLKLVLIGSVFVAALEVATSVFNIPISLHWIALFYLAREIAIRIRSHIFYEHKIFPWLSVICMILLFYISGVWSILIINISVARTINFELVKIALNPVFRFYFLLPLGSYFYQIGNIIEVLFFLAVLILSYRYTK